MTSQISHSYPEKSDRLITGHGIFDEIMDITFGSTVLSLDETFSEGRDFLSALFLNYKNVPIYEVAKKPVFRNFQTLSLDEDQHDVIIEGMPPTSFGDSVDQ